MNTPLANKLKTLPRSPGVYFHKSKSGEIIYVGKAAVLKNRVRQYFQTSKHRDVKTNALVEEIFDTDWVETESEVDALFLESEMVKRYMPRFNVLLRDDKSQLFVRIDMPSEWPHVSFTRAPLDDGAHYVGPFYNGYAVKKALRYLRKAFPYYIKPPVTRQRDLDTHIGLNPPIELTSQQYKSSLKQLIRYIEGGRVSIVRELEKDMKRAAREQDFEQAANLRNKLQALKELQRRIMFGDREFLDISKDVALNDLQQLLGIKSPLARIEGYDVSHMSGSDVVASMVVFANGVSDRASYRKFKMRLQRNNDTANLQETITRRFSERNRTSWGLPDLLLIDGGKPQLSAAIEALEKYELKIPCIGIAKREEEIIIHATKSNIPDAVQQQLLSMHKPGVSVNRDGEFIIVNLHAGQLNASGHSRNLRAGTGEQAYSEVVKLFQRIRDEAHRFAVSYHTTLKRTRQTTSWIDEIPGVGPATKKKLMRSFGSVKAIQMASENELKDAVGPAITKRIVAAKVREG